MPAIQPVEHQQVHIADEHHRQHGVEVRLLRPVEQRCEDDRHEPVIFVHAGVDRNVRPESQQREPHQVGEGLLALEEHDQRQRVHGEEEQPGNQFYGIRRAEDQLRLTVDQGSVLRGVEHVQEVRNDPIEVEHVAAQKVMVAGVREGGEHGSEPEDDEGEREDDGCRGEDLLEDRAQGDLLPVAQAVDAEDVQRDERGDDQWLPLGEEGEAEGDGEERKALFFERPQCQHQGRREEDIQVAQRHAVDQQPAQQQQREQQVLGRTQRHQRGEQQEGGDGSFDRGVDPDVEPLAELTDAEQDHQRERRVGIVVEAVILEQPQVVGLVDPAHPGIHVAGAGRGDEEDDEQHDTENQDDLLD